MTSAVPVKPVEKTVPGEGKICSIKLPLHRGFEVFWLPKVQDNPPVCVKVYGDAPYFIYLHDHREIAKQAFRDGGSEAWEATLAEMPCLATFRRRPGTKFVYIALADVDDPLTDIVDDGAEYALLTAPFDRKLWRVVTGNGGPAIHPATGICIVEKRPTEA